MRIPQSLRIDVTILGYDRNWKIEGFLATDRIFVALPRRVRCPGVCRLGAATDWIGAATGDRRHIASTCFVFCGAFFALGGGGTIGIVAIGDDE
jgi:hypothetical protein